MKKKILLILQTIFLIAASQGCSAQSVNKEPGFIDSKTSNDVITKKEYPPYPNIWWRKIDIKEINFPMYAIVLETGDILFVSINPPGSSPKQYGSDTYEVGIEFFSGKKYEISRKELRARGLQRLDYLPVIRLGEYEYKANAGAPLPLGDYKGLDNKVEVYQDGKKISEKAFIYILDKPREFNGDLPSGEPVIFTETLYSMALSFIPLGDAGFLAMNRESGLIIRFDKDFLTQADILNKKVFILDYLKVEEIKRQASLRDEGKSESFFYSTWNNLLYQHIAQQGE